MNITVAAGCRARGGSELGIQRRYPTNIAVVEGGSLGDLASGSRSLGYGLFRCRRPRWWLENISQEICVEGNDNNSLRRVGGRRLSEISELLNYWRGGGNHRRDILGINSEADLVRTEIGEACWETNCPHRGASECFSV